MFVVLRRMHFSVQVVVQLVVVLVVELEWGGAVPPVVVGVVLLVEQLEVQFVGGGLVQLVVQMREQLYIGDCEQICTG